MLIFLTGAYSLAPLKTAGTDIVNVLTGESVHLRGFNIDNQAWGFWEWPVSDNLAAENKMPMIPSLELANWYLQDDDYANLANSGCSVVRYNLNHEQFSRKNPLRDQNMRDLKGIIQRLASHGIYTVICSQYQAGFNVSHDEYEDPKPGSDRVLSLFESPAVYAEWEEMWVYIATHCVDIPEVAGYELNNEPRLPAKEDISLSGAVGVYEKVIAKIRAVDPDHIIFVPEFHSREASIGEEYHNDDGNLVTDAGEQGIVWESGWAEIPQTVENIVYVFHCYAPYEFASGTSSENYSSEVLRGEVEEKVHWTKTQNRPVFCSEYGVSFHENLNGNKMNRLRWYKEIHGLFNELNVASAVYTYKDVTDPFNSPTDHHGIWCHFKEWQEEMKVVDSRLVFKNPATKAEAESNGFIKMQELYFTTPEEANTISKLGNELIIEELNRYFTGKTPTSVTSAGRVVERSLVTLQPQLNTISVNSSSPVNLRICDVKGRTLFKKSNFYSTTTLPALSSGVYFCRVTTAEKSENLRFMCK